MPKIVQFTHPGSEHKPDKKNGNIKSWNTGAHKRKFMMCNGEYVENNKASQAKLELWGEWEPPSYVKSFANTPDKFHPQWIHEPFLPQILPMSNGYQISYQNTDPCIFGDTFKYFVCKQFKPKNRKLTSLAKLDKGSIILFGSTGNQNTKNAFFQLDTVFVVSDFIEYDISDPNALNGIGLGNYRDYVFKMAFPVHSSYSLKLRLYLGATFNNPYKRMYSFAPSKLWKDETKGFPRIKLKDIKYVTNNLNAAPKFSEDSIEDIYIFWNEIRDIIKKQGCVEGVKFDYGKEKTGYNNV